MESPQARPSSRCGVRRTSPRRVRPWTVSGLALATSKSFTTWRMTVAMPCRRPKKTLPMSNKRQAENLSKSALQWTQAFQALRACWELPCYRQSCSPRHKQVAALATALVTLADQEAHLGRKLPCSQHCRFGRAALVQWAARVAWKALHLWGQSALTHPVHSLLWLLEPLALVPTLETTLLPLQFCHLRLWLSRPIHHGRRSSSSSKRVTKMLLQHCRRKVHRWTPRPFHRCARQTLFRHRGCR
mmetsp:Transcript_90671/g.170955  ORF Transcript_90671/g.170955 Transcript_90671/m.170955 type:complete len:244 (-) Transcript_90671:101-832(-)